MVADLERAATRFPVATVLGPRQSGKTTLVRACFPDHEYVNLENPETRRIAGEDPRELLRGGTARVILDEVQRVPELLSWVQVFADREHAAGQFILTGRNQPLLGEALAQSLAGRTSIHRLLPYHANLRKRLIRTPKLYFTEPGLLAWLLQIDTTSQVSRDPLLGGIYENMVVVEALKAAWNRGEEPRLSFYRDSSGLEIDLIREYQRRLFAIQIKAARTFTPETLRTFDQFRQIGADPAGSAVVYAGPSLDAVRGTPVVNHFETASVVMGR